MYSIQMKTQAPNKLNRLPRAVPGEIPGSLLVSIQE